MQLKEKRRPANQRAQADRIQAAKLTRQTGLTTRRRLQHTTVTESPARATSRPYFSSSTLSEFRTNGSKRFQTQIQQVWPPFPENPAETQSRRATSSKSWSERKKKVRVFNQLNSPARLLPAATSASTQRSTCSTTLSPPSLALRHLSVLSPLPWEPRRGRPLCDGVRAAEPHSAGAL